MQIWLPEGSTRDGDRLTCALPAGMIALLFMTVAALPVQAEGELRIDAIPQPHRLESAACVPLKYRLEHAGSLSTGNWTSVAATSGVSGTVTWELPDTPAAEGFYRLAIDTSSDVVMVQVASGAVHFLRQILEISPGGTGALPRNEAHQSELESGSFFAETFVPAQLGTWVTVACLGHAYRNTNSSFTAGMDTAELTNHVDAIATAITNILANHAYTDGGTGTKAFYQVHEIGDGNAPRGNAWERTVSLLDNTLLIAGLAFAAEYVEPLNAGLAARLDAILAQFDLRLWMDSDSGRFQLGGSENPRDGAFVDRLTSEARFCPVLARARGEITATEFAHIVKSMRAASTWTNMPSGRFIQHLPFAGTALEIWSPAPYLSVETDTDFARNTLDPLAAEWDGARQAHGVAAIGATGIADGDGGFRLFVQSPREGAGGTAAPEVLVLPSVGMQAGAMSNAVSDANLLYAAHAAGVGGSWHPEYGWPNYQDFGSGLVNTNDPVWGTLEVGQMAVCLLNRLLGDNFIENTLRGHSGWTDAYAEYAALLTNHLWEAEYYVSKLGGAYRGRSKASSEETVYLSGTGESVTYRVPFLATTNYVLTLRFSNDDAGAGDDLQVSIDDTPRTTLHTPDTHNWNTFGTVSQPIGLVTAGVHTLTLTLTTTDGWGVEPDRLEIAPSSTP